MAFNAFVGDILPAIPEAELYMATDRVPEHPAVTNGGFPSNEELAERMGRSWMFLYPNSYEGFGIPYIGAMASGTAIVTTRNPGAELVLAQGEYGVITSDEEFPAGALTLLRDPERRMELERAGLERVQHYSWKSVARRHMEFLQATISKYYGR